MRLDEFRLCVRPGQGLVARFPTAILVVTASTWAGMPAVDRLLEECGRVNADRPLPARLGDLVEDAEPQKVPAFCAIAGDADGLALFVHGDSQVVITGAQPVMRLSGHATSGWTGGIHDRVASLLVGPATGSPEVVPTDNLVDLRDGVVPGGAILLVSRDEPIARGLPGVERHHFAESPSLPPVEADQPGDAPVALAPPLPETPTPPTPPRPQTSPVVARAAPVPAPISAPTPAPRAALPPVLAVSGVSSLEAVPGAAIDGAPVMVWGVHCKRGHFNNADARYCRQCGTHMVHQRRDPVLGPRPVLGFLIVDDGSTYKLDADYVIGRQPEQDESVGAGDARGLSLSDPEDSVSPVHAAVRLDKWNVFLTDLRSRYGTHIWTPGAAGWVRLEPGQKVMLEPRTHMLFGRRTMVFDSMNRR
jgi:hypothetical protein